MFCHILRSVKSAVGTGPSADRWIDYYITILNSNWSVCMKPVLPHVEQSAMSLSSRSDVWHEQTSYASAALRSPISRDRLDWRQSSKTSYCTAAWLPLINFRRRIGHWKWPYMVTVRRRIDQCRRLWRRRWRRTYFLGPQGEGSAAYVWPGAHFHFSRIFPLFSCFTLPREHILQSYHLDGVDVFMPNCKVHEAICVHVYPCWLWMTKELMKWSGRPEICTSIALTWHACCLSSTQDKSFVPEYCYVVTLKLERRTHEITYAISVILSHSVMSHNTNGLSDSTVPGLLLWKAARFLDTSCMLLLVHNAYRRIHHDAGLSNLMTCTGLQKQRVFFADLW